MKDLKKTCKLALIQASPVLFNKKEGTKKAVKLIEEASREKVELIVFPELFLPGYPFGMTFDFTVGSRKEPGRKDWKRYYDHSLLIPGEETQALAAAAKKAGAYLSIGVSERDRLSATLYNSNLIFSPEGELLCAHRKLKPTGAERVVWGDANQGYFPVVDTPWGPMGSMICWESYMPLARVALYEKGVTLYLSPNTNDNEQWQATARHIAIEGHCYFINSNLFFTKEDYPKDLKTYEEIEALPEMVCRGGSCVIDPYGNYLTEPVWDQEAIIYAELDLDQVPMSRMEFDACGHYARPDVFQFTFKDE